MTIANQPPTANKKLLRQELSAVGLNATEAWKMLPGWWEDAISDPTGVFEIKGFIAQHYGLEIGPDGRLRRRQMSAACFKTRTGTDVEAIASARALASAVACDVSSVTIPPWQGSFPSARDLRQRILEAGSGCVSLDDLLSACWNAGVPVIYMPSLPVTGSKMDGMVTFCCGRPVILITKKTPAPAWMLFILAHEMGHVALGHLEQREGGALVDEDVSEEANQADDQERTANAYAIELLTGNKYFSLARALKAPSLARAAILRGRQEQIDPGHIILHAVKNTEMNGKIPWGLAGAALKLIGQDVPVALMCAEHLKRNLDLDALSDDSFEFLERIGLFG